MEILTSTGLVSSKGTTVIVATVASVPGGMLTGLSGVEVNLTGVGGTIGDGVVAGATIDGGKAVVVCKRRH